MSEREALQEIAQLSDDLATNPFATLARIGELAAAALADSADTVAELQKENREIRDYYECLLAEYEGGVAVPRELLKALCDAAGETAGNLYALALDQPNEKYRRRLERNAQLTVERIDRALPLLGDKS